MSQTSTKIVDLPAGEQSSTGMPLVVAVVLTWNDTEKTSACISSVLENDYPRLRVVLVDNGSVPARGPELQAAFPDIELLQLESNQGFSGGANRGMEKALEMSADYVHLIGNDSTLSTDVISKLVEQFEARPDVAAATPLLLYEGDKPIVQFYKASLNRELALHDHFPPGDPYEKGAWPVTESEFIPCVALCFRATALREVGLFDEVFGTCWEDFDLCIRLHDRGWKYITVGDATAVHLGSFTTGRVSPYITYYTTRNRLICLHRYSTRWIWFRHGIDIARSFWRQIKGYGVGNWPCHKAFALGFVHFMFNVQGERRQHHAEEIPGQRRLHSKVN